MSKQAGVIVNAVIDELMCRAGFDSWRGGIDDETWGELVDDLVDTVTDILDQPKDKT